MTSGECRVPSVSPRPICFPHSSAYESRDKAGTSVAGNNVDAPADAGAASDDDQPKGKASGGFSAFASLGMEDTAANDEEDEDFGGLMVSWTRNSLPRIHN